MPAISYQAVSKSYPSPRSSQKSFLALDRVSLDIERGEFFGLLGPNGAGKTTMISILAGLTRATSGSVSVLGSDVVSDYAQARRKLGVVPQELVFDPFFSVREALRFQSGYFGIANNDAWIDELLHSLGLADKAHANTRQLSGGMKAKLALAMAIAPRPEFLILDEPTAGLDPVARRDFMEIIVAQARQHRRTTFFSSHLIDEVERCADRIGIIHQGRMKFEGELSDLRTQIKRVTYLDQPTELPNSFELWNERIVESKVSRVYRATADQWSQIALSNVDIAGSLSLEEIFIACVGTKRVAI